MKILSAEDKIVLESTAMFAMARWEQGWWKEAEQLNVRVIETRKIKLGEDHPDTLINTANLVVTYMH